MLCIGIGMVHSVKYAINPRTHIRRPLGYIRIDVKEFFPSFAHSKRSMRSIAMVKERLSKKGKVPVRYKKNNDYSHERK